MRLPNAEVLRHTSRYLELIAGREMSLEEKQSFIAETVDSYERYYNRGFITYRKSVTQAGQFAALEWSGEGSVLHDLLGREYIDCLGGYGIFSAGVNHPTIVKALTSIGADPQGGHGARGDAAGRAPGAILSRPIQSDLNADDLRRLASPRARLTIRGVGVFEIALFTSQAPATVLRFAHLAEAGYYNGLTFHRVVPNFVIQGGSPGANEYVGDASFMRDEVGLWPHVRGAVGISTRGHDTGDAQIFVDLVDNPRLDHTYTVFAQVLNGIEIVDQILEGDVIERVEIVPGP